MKKLSTFTAGTLAAGFLLVSCSEPDEPNITSTEYKNGDRSVQFSDHMDPNETDYINFYQKGVVILQAQQKNMSPDEAKSQAVHYLKTGFVPTGGGINIKNDLFP